MPVERAPLAGVRVLDLTAIVMGPLATQVLGDLGADVIKIEPPEGDVLRRAGAPPGSDLGPLFVHLNRNKRSVVLDLKGAEGKAALLRLAGEADVLVHSMRPQAMARLGLGYEALSAMNHRLIYAGLFGFGQRGPYAEQGAFDDLIQAVSGLADLVGRLSDGRPRYVPANIADRSVGLYAFGLISAALYQRERTGNGCELGVPMFETLASLLFGDHLYGETFRPAHGTMGYPRLMVRDRGPFPTSDGHICCMIYTDAQWRSFLTALGRDPDLAKDPMLSNMTSRTINSEALFTMVSDITRTLPTAHWVATLRAVGLTVVAMRSLEELVDDSHLAATGFFHDARTSNGESLRLFGPVGDWSNWEPAMRHSPPHLGEHTQDVLANGWATRHPQP
ncbi:CaiB/BaiF CoA transferase family protein [Bosea sp. (in: a-proteobacteria)]|uniref:CaiB/BaiF CoA transferase family protein n=1 Tax=Bosea sp. (in: a-proteobacteria) TaxID=1871050 RepID=UPI003B3BCDDB